MLTMKKTKKMNQTVENGANNGIKEPGTEAAKEQQGVARSEMPPNGDSGRQGGEEQPTAANAARSLPAVEPEPADDIRVGGGGKLIVPREDLDADLDDGVELDLLNLQAKKIRKPNRREWVVLNPASELPTRMLLHKPRPDAIETDHYYVEKALRGAIRDELKEVRVFTYYSLKLKTFALWVVNVTLENSWYESIAQVFKRPPEFFAKNAIRVVLDKANGRYRVLYKPVTLDIHWPTKTTNELLGEALGHDHFISSADHPVYAELIEGTELD
jgi:hypothetical protein